MTGTYLTTGEVAQRAGVSVRTLHHYDSIGLLRPDARSEAGYRLYGAQDIARLHAVQSLKSLGLSLEVIASALAGQGIEPKDLLQRQVQEAQRMLTEARALKDKLQFLEDAVSGQQGSFDDLLAGIRLLDTYRLYLPAAGIRQMLGRWRRARPRWQPVADALLRCRAEGLEVGTAQVQLLAQRWMNVAMTVFRGRLGLIQNWARMHEHEPHTARHAGLEPELLTYLEQAIGLRMAALQRHLTTAELQELDGSTGPDWEVFAASGEKLLARGVAAQTAVARQLRVRYRELSLRTAGNNPLLAAKLAQAYATEPVLALGHFVSPKLRDYLNTIEA